MNLPVASDADVLRHTRRLLRPHRRRLWLLAAAVLFGSAALVGAPLLVRYAIDSGVRGGDTSAIDRAALALACLAVVGGGLTYARVRLSGIVAESVLADLRAESARRVLGLSVGDLRGTTRGDVVTRLTGDIEVLSEVLRLGVPRIVQSLSLLTVSLTVLVVVSLPLAVVGLVGLVTVFVNARLLLRRTRPIYAAYRERLGTTIGMMGETVAGVRVIRAHGRGPDRAAAYQERNDAVVASLMDGMRARNRFYPKLIVIQSLSTLAVVVAGTVLANAGRVTVGTVTAAVLAVVGVFGPVEDLADWLDEINSAAAAFGRVVGLLDLSPVVGEPASPRPLPSSGDLTLRDVSFRYADDPRLVVDGVSLTLQPGERVALVGATGAGKSTLARLVARLDDPVSGAVAYGGVDLRDALLAEVRRRIVLTPQEGHLLVGTIADNVRLARPSATDESVVAALESIGAGAWIRSLPHGIETQVSALGSRLSAGERQLVALARVALADPRVVVLDEATSALDLGTEMMVERALELALAGRTVLVVAHRATTAARCDRVAVMDGGRLVEVGSHEELVAAGGEYAALWSAWARAAS